MAKITPSARADECRRLLSLYLQGVMLSGRWTQTAIARVMGVAQSNVSRAIREKQIIDYHRVMALAKATGSPIPHELEAAYLALARAETPAESVDYWRAMAELGKQLARATSDEEAEAIKARMRDLEASAA